MKTVAILQSNYIPWKGYFDLIAAVDEFILYDDMQYTKNDWRNRNQIKTTGSGKALLTHSCTAALEMCALLLDLQPGDEVIMPSYTFVSTPMPSSCAARCRCSSISAKTRSTSTNA